MSISRVHGGAGGGDGGGPGALIALPRRVMVRKSIWRHERTKKRGRAALSKQVSGLYSANVFLECGRREDIGRKGQFGSERG